MARIKKLYDDYEDCLFPKKLKMKRSYDKRSNIENPDMQKLTYHEGSSNMKWYYTYTDHFIASRVGLKYDDVFSEYCQKMPYWYGDVNTRKWFNELLFDKYWNTHYVDDEGIIRSHKKINPVKAKPIHVKTNDSTVLYKIDKNYFDFIGRWSFQRFIKKFGNSFFWKCRQSEFISEDQFIAISVNLTDDDCKPFGKRSFLKNAFERVVIHGKVVFPGDKDYLRYLYEERSRKRKEKRELEKLKNNKENEYTKYLKLDKRRRRIQDYNKRFEEKLREFSF